MKVFVVTDPELGWDCVVGVFHELSKEALKEQFPDDQYVVREHQVENNFKDYE